MIVKAIFCLFFSFFSLMPYPQCSTVYSFHRNSEYESNHYHEVFRKFNGKTISIGCFNIPSISVAHMEFFFVVFARVFAAVRPFSFHFNIGNELCAVYTERKRNREE